MALPFRRMANYQPPRQSRQKTRLLSHKPTEETIRRGALASIQILLNQGVDPATFDPGRSAELEAERKRLEEEAECAREEQEAERKRAEMERRALMEQRRRESAAAGGTVQEQRPAVFTGLDLLDDEDDD